MASWVFGDPNGSARLVTWLATAIAGSAAATMSEIGTTFNDIPVSALLIGGFVIGCRNGGERPPFGTLFVAGALVGAAVALKPTAVVFAPGVIVAIIIGAVGWRARGRVFVGIGTGGLLAVAVLAGPWALLLMHYFDSPTFPQMNGIFRSPWYPPDNIFVDRYLPRNTWQALFYPFFWI